MRSSLWVIHAILAVTSGVILERDGFSVHLDSVSLSCDPGCILKTMLLIHEAELVNTSIKHIQLAYGNRAAGCNVTLIELSFSNCSGIATLSDDCEVSSANTSVADRVSLLNASENSLAVKLEDVDTGTYFLTVRLGPRSHSFGVHIVSTGRSDKTPISLLDCNGRFPIAAVKEMAQHTTQSDSTRSPSTYTITTHDQTTEPRKRIFVLPTVLIGVMLALLLVCLSVAYLRTRARERLALLATSPTDCNKTSHV
ncbi:membrane protein TE31 [Testudinid alphaherpesvirus 3]|uniref:Membrane protein TE31 n=1 Tax=Testudinid alphaherpesvirus 3 TaxID=2560801 RepID=A0A0M3MZ63_9ALPH|nr:membrane protein TE31 [Testudinid alphaherpesvirus 3]AKI81690.1 membrane protein TE31 [Testudinid alphaherpesvirus 3]AKI81793.1 membrane protein TE31 [Testudinid alphaherpesvirus 3]